MSLLQELKLQLVREENRTQILDVWGPVASFFLLFTSAFSPLIVTEINSVIHHRGDDGIFPHNKTGFALAKNSPIIIT